VDTGSEQPQPGAADTALEPVRVFINYRHEDTWGEALLLHGRLAERFGRHNVFLDGANLRPGMNWLDEIKRHHASCDVVLSLIGPRWTAILKEREQASYLDLTEDYVRMEIEYALRPNSGILLIPVLVGDDVPFVGEGLSTWAQPLAKIEAALIRPKLFDDDTRRLMTRIEEVAEERTRAGSTNASQLEPGGPLEVRRDPSLSSRVSAVPPPDEAQFGEVLEEMVQQGNLVVFLGPQLSALPGARPTERAALPDTRELAATLAQRFGIELPRPDLPEVAQYVYVSRGKPDLYRTLRQLIPADVPPGAVARFLARFPRALEDLGLEKRYQLIVSTGFDRALEQAFDDEGESYDLAVYMASGQDKGKFVHFPYDGTSRVISDPNSYTELPIGIDFDLERTVIVKIHGAVDGKVGDYRWRENYVITQDHYIDYLSRSPIESLVPVQVLDKLRESHCLFLGYTVRDWNLRVFLKRIWDGNLGAKSWAVEADPDGMEKDFWKQSTVDLSAADLSDYVDQLHARLIATYHMSDGT
jgi:SIR2-like domain/TIR domain